MQGTVYSASSKMTPGEARLFDFLPKYYNKRPGELMSIIDQVLQEGGNINISNTFGDSVATVYFQSCWTDPKNVDNFRRLLYNGLDITGMGQDGLTCLMAANSLPARRDGSNQDSAAYLILNHIHQKGYSVKDFVMKRSPKSFFTALHFAAACCSPQILKNYIYALHQFLSDDDFKEVMAQRVEIFVEPNRALTLQEAEQEPYSKQYALALDDYGSTALHLAAAAKIEDNLCQLHGSSTGLWYGDRDAYGRTALMRAVQSPYCVRRMLSGFGLGVYKEKDLSSLVATDCYGESLVTKLYAEYLKFRDYDFKITKEYRAAIKEACYLLRNGLEQSLDACSNDEKKCSARDQYGSHIQDVFNAACWGRDVEMAGMALDAGADPDDLAPAGGGGMIPALLALLYRQSGDTVKQIESAYMILCKCIAYLKERHGLSHEAVVGDLLKTSREVSHGRMVQLLERSMQEGKEQS